MAGKPLPKNVRQLRGNPGRRKIREDIPDPKVPRRLPPAPRHLDKETQKAWRALGKKLLGMNVLTPADLHALEVLAECWVLWRRAADDVRENGYKKISQRGAETLNPSMQVMRDMSSKVEKLLGEFGMTPAGRMRVMKLK